MTTVLVDSDQCAAFLRALDAITEAVNSLKAICGERQTTELLQHFLETMPGPDTGKLQ